MRPGLIHFWGKQVQHAAIVERSSLPHIDPQQFKTETEDA
jgi:hypothetical protein